MMIKRFLSYIGMAFALCLGSFTVQAAEQIVYVTAASFSEAGSFGAVSARHELTLSQWRTSGHESDTLKTSNMIALSNHFGLASAAPFGVPDWDRTANI